MPQNWVLPLNNMAIKVNVGNKIKELVAAKPRKYKIQEMAFMLGINRGQFYIIVNNPMMKIQYAVKFGEIFNCDFINDATLPLSEVEELRVLLVNVQNKYIALLEENKRLLMGKKGVYSEGVFK